MRIKTFTQSLVCLILGIGVLIPATAQKVTSSGEGVENSAVPSRVVEHVDDAKLVRLPGNVHPMAQAKFDKGRVDPGKLLERMVLVLKRSPEQEAALEAFNERQYDPESPDFHGWLHAEEFGKLYGPSDSDIAQVTSWLENHGFQIYLVTKGRVSIQFTGSVKQVEEAFHVEMHNYMAGGRMHISNDRDPSIPEALSPAIAGIASLNDFFPKHYSHPGNLVKRDLKTGKYTVLESEYARGGEKKPGSGSLAGKGKGGGIQPELGYIDSSTGYQREELSPYDVATIYNILPLWNASTPINGTGVSVAIVGLSDVVTSDFNTYRSSFGLPAGTLQTMHSGADPGITGSEGENIEDTEMVSATAPGAKVILVADVDNATTNGLITGITYIVDNEIAPILTMSYGACEADMGSTDLSLFNSIFQQAATAGISSFVAAGDSGSAVCTSQDGTPPYADTFGLAVSGMASTPYVTAVGGTDLQWPFVANPYTDYWNSSNDSHGASAKGYMPEMSWNDTCSNPFLLNVYTNYSDVEGICNAAINQDSGLVEMAAGSGGVSTVYSKPSWQTGVTGIPADGMRDLPDVSMFAAYGFQSSTGIPGSALLICESRNGTNGCDYSNPDYIIYQENGGTSAASPMTAGIMALIVQKTGKAQGLANPMFYKLAAKENYASCDSNTVAAGNSCIFYDTTSGSNAAVCITGDPDCDTNTNTDEVGILSGYSATTGYDLTTGLGTFNVTNLVNAWSSASTAGKISLSAASLAYGLQEEGSSSQSQSVTVTNTGTTAVTFTSIAVTGTNASSFAIGNNCGTSLAAGASCSVHGHFAPTAATAMTAAITLKDNAAGSPQSIGLTGTGVAIPTLSFSAKSLAFGRQEVGHSSLSQSVTVTNTGKTAVTSISIKVTGTNAASFAFGYSCGTSLAAGASCTIHGHFGPTAASAMTAAITLTDSASGSPQSIALSGTGVSTPSLSLSATSLAYGFQKIGTASASQTVTVTNTGGATVTFTGIAVTGTNASAFGFANTCGSSLAVGASCTIHGHFAPATSTAMTAAITITDSASGSPQTVALTGTGMPE